MLHCTLLMYSSWY